MYEVNFKGVKPPRGRFERETLRQCYLTPQYYTAPIRKTAKRPILGQFRGTGHRPKKEQNMTVKQQLKRIEIVPADEYEVVLVSVDEGEAGEHGPMWIWSFGISSGEYADVEITGVSSQTYSTYPSKSYKWAIAIGHPREVDFDASLIEGLPCRLSISVEEKPDAGERNRITDVLAPTKAQLGAVASVPDQAPAQSEIPTDPVGEPPPVGEQMAIPS